MKYWIILMMAACLWVAPVGAQVDPNPDGIGIYADLAGMVNEVEVEVGVPREVYLLLTRPSGTGQLGGFDCDIVVPDNISIWGWNITIPGALSISTPPGFVVGWPAIPYQTVNLLMTFIIVPQDSEPALFYITLYTGPGGGDAPRYVDVREELPIRDRNTLINMTPYAGGFEEAVFAVNATALPVTTAAWGEVKALYR